jgi:predicted amidohydrolase YtcJ
MPATTTSAELTQLEAAGITAGPVKILLDDANLPALDDLAETISWAHRQRRSVAVHCVTRVQLLLTLAALDVAGPRRGDRIEHGAVIAPEAVPAIADRGLIVVTQPNFVTERGDQYLAEVPAFELTDLWRGRSLVDAGVSVAAGTDAPFGGSDPWLSIRAAVRRRTASGKSLGPNEAVPLRTALTWWWGTGRFPAVRRRLDSGAPADLVVLSAPLPEAVKGDGRVAVVATFIGGNLVTKDEG